MFRNKETLQSRGEMNYGEDKRTDGHASEWDIRDVIQG